MIDDYNDDDDDGDQFVKCPNIHGKAMLVTPDWRHGIQGQLLTGTVLDKVS